MQEAWDALTDLRSECQLESEISLTDAAIATPLSIPLNSTMLDSGRAGRLAGHAGDP